MVLANEIVEVASAVAAAIDGGDVDAPDLFMLGTTQDGRDVAGRLSVKLDAPVITNVVDIHVDGDDVVVIEDTAMIGRGMRARLGDGDVRSRRDADARFQHAAHHALRPVEPGDLRDQQRAAEASGLHQLDINDVGGALFQHLDALLRRYGTPGGAGLSGACNCGGR